MRSTSYLRDEYTARINRVIDHVEANLDGDLSLEVLAAVAGFSRFHFHRVFRAMLGETLNDFINRIRVEKAALQLVQNPKESITEIALACGFSGPATFARAFRLAYGQSASEWRAGGHRRHPASPDLDGRDEGREERKECKAPRNAGKAPYVSPSYPEDEARLPTTRAALRYEERRRRMSNVKPVQVKVEEVPAFEVAYVRHIGPYKGDGKLFEELFGKLMRWAGPRGLLGAPDLKTLVIYHDNPEITEAEKLRISVCVSIPANTPVDGEIGKMAIPAGKYALARFELGADEYQGAWDYVFGEWLPGSGYQPDDGPCFEMYHGESKDHPEQKQVVDICLPVRPL